jgi:preprotein translocase subunit YajC
MTFASLLVFGHGAPVLLAAAAKKSSGSPAFFIFLILLFGVYFLWLRPQRQKLRASQAQRGAPEVGDEVVTASGIIGRLVEIEGDRAKVEIAPGQYLTILRTAVGRRLDPVIPESADDHMASSDDEHDDHDHDDHDHGDHEGHDHGSDDTPPQRRWWPGSSGSGGDAPEGSN